MSKKNKKSSAENNDFYIKNETAKTNAADPSDNGFYIDEIVKKGSAAPEVPPSERTEEAPDGREAKKHGAGYFIRIAGVLTLICSVVALMLSTVNMVTLDKIAENTEAEKKNAVAEIFTDMSDAVLYDRPTENEIYLVFKDNMLYGYCASVTSQGYGGAIEMMVGVDAAGNVAGVKIVSMSETAGLGSKTRGDSFLSQFSAAAAPFTVGENIDAVAGATISSRAVTAGGNSALEHGVDLEAVCAEGGWTLWPGGEEASEEVQPESTESAASPVIPQITVDLGGRSETNISPDAVGNENQSPNYYSQDNSYTGSMEQRYYIEKETTDTEETSGDGITG